MICLVYIYVLFDFFNPPSGVRAPGAHCGSLRRWPPSAAVGAKRPPAGGPFGAPSGGCKGGSGDAEDDDSRTTQRPNSFTNPMNWTDEIKICENTGNGKNRGWYPSTGVPKRIDSVDFRIPILLHKKNGTRRNKKQHIYPNRGRWLQGEGELFSVQNSKKTIFIAEIFGCFRKNDWENFGRFFRRETLQSFWS